jgi:hypothetical protein
MALRIGILRVGQGNAKDLLHEAAVLESLETQLRPIRAFAAFDHIVEGSQRVSPMIQMPMQHGRSFPKTR